jgi:hypothetical protein
MWDSRGPPERPKIRRRPLPNAPLGDEEFEVESSLFPRGTFVRIKNGPFRGRVGQVVSVRGQTNKKVRYLVSTIDNAPRIRIGLNSHELEHVDLTPLEILAMQALPDEEEG